MNLLATSRGRRALFTFLYFTEGAPIGFLWWALPTMLRAAGVELGALTLLLSTLVLPWALKFLWAPLVDVLRSARFGFRGWIVGCQIVMALTLLPLAGGGLDVGMAWITSLLFVHAMAAATQDAAIDALAIRSAGEDERGSLNGWMQAGMLAGRSTFGGGLLVFREPLGDTGIILLLVSVLGLSLLVACVYREVSPPPRRPDESPLRVFLDHLRRVVSARTTWLALFFAAIAGAGFEAVGGLAGPMLVDRGMTSADVGRFFALPAVGCMAAGALVGGALSDRLGRRASVGGFHVWLTASIVLFASVAGSAGSTETYVLLAAVYVAIGLFTASSYALFMDLTDRDLGATQFSAFMGATNLCEAWAVLAAGHLAGAWGYGPAFTALAILSVLALPALAGLGPRLR